MMLYKKTDFPFFFLMLISISNFLTAVKNTDSLFIIYYCANFLFIYMYIGQKIIMFIDNNEYINAF